MITIFVLELKKRMGKVTTREIVILVKVTTSKVKLDNGQSVLNAKKRLNSNNQYQVQKTRNNTMIQNKKYSENSYAKYLGMFLRL